MSNSLEQEKVNRTPYTIGVIVVAFLLICALIGAVVPTGSVASPETNVTGSNASSTATSTPTLAPSSTPTPSPEATSGKDDDEVVLSPELRKQLDASLVALNKYECPKIIADARGDDAITEGIYKLYLKTLNGLVGDPDEDDPRKWSDAISTPLPGVTPKHQYKMLKRALCEEPLLADAFAHLLANLKIGNIAFADLQSTNWIEPYRVDDSQINDLTADFLPVVDWKLKNPGKSQVPNSVYRRGIQGNLDFQELASRLVYVLSKYELASATSLNSTHHYHLVAGGLTADGIPEVEISNEVDRRPALVFYLTEKTACKPISVIGFNLGDKRPMLGSIPNSCDTPKKKTTKDRDKDRPKSDCPPPKVKNQNGKCVVPKSKDAKDYTYPKGKKKVTVGDEGPSDPDKVVKKKKGGRGVDDSATKKPGSETGVKAPGDDTEDPPDSEGETPKKEGGDNDGRVTAP